MNKLEEILGEFYEEDDMPLSADGFDDAVIGFDLKSRVLIYDANKMLSILRNGNEMSAEEAWEFFEFNILGAYVGDETPIYMMS
jgi:hypothetical protein